MKKIGILILIVFSLSSCSTEADKERIDISGSWKLKPSNHNYDEEYLEYYITSNEFYVLSEYGLINSFEYEITDDLIFRVNDTVTVSDPKIEIKDTEFILNLPNSTKIIYEKIKKGILPKVYIENKELKDCYYISFFNRQNSYIDSGNRPN